MNIPGIVIAGATSILVFHFVIGRISMSCITGSKPGGIVMLFVTLLVFVAVTYFSNWIIGIIGSILFFASWYQLNIHAGTPALFKANTRTYFARRRWGENHQDALEGVIQSRYPFLRSKP
jgi:hypothetical protein